MHTVAKPCHACSPSLIERILSILGAETEYVNDVLFPVLHWSITSWSDCSTSQYRLIQLLPRSNSDQHGQNSSRHGQADQAPFASDVVQATQQEAAEPPRFFDLAKHGFHDHLASGVQCLAFRRPHFRCHAFLHCDGRLRGFGLRHMVPLALGGDVRIEP